MKSIKKLTLLTLLVAGCTPVPVRPVPGIVIALFQCATVFSFGKFIANILSRHHYARNFLTNPRKVATYSIEATVLHRGARSFQGKSGETKLFTEKKYEDVIKKCCSWLHSRENVSIIRLKPSLELLSHKTYKLKRLSFKASQYIGVEGIEQELIDIFIIPGGDSVDQFRLKTAAWGIVPLATLATFVYFLYKLSQLRVIPPQC